MSTNYIFSWKNAGSITLWTSTGNILSHLPGTATVWTSFPPTGSITWSRCNKVLTCTSTLETYLRMNCSISSTNTTYRSNISSSMAIWTAGIRFNWTGIVVQMADWTYSRHIVYISFSAETQILFRRVVSISLFVYAGIIIQMTDRTYSCSIVYVSILINSLSPRLYP